MTTKTGSGPAPPFANSNPLPGLLETILGLAIVLILVVITIRFLARRSHIRRPGGIDVLAARQIAPGKSEQVIEVEGRRFLIGVGEQVSLLADVTQEYEILQQRAAETAREPTFGDVLARALREARTRHGRANPEEEES